MGMRDDYGDVAAAADDDNDVVIFGRDDVDSCFDRPT